MNIDRPPPDFPEMLKALAAHNVDYVVIGGVAGRAHGDPRFTWDLDITPDPDPANMQRLAEALIAMEALLRPPDSEPVHMELDGRTIARFSTMATRTRHGDLDVVVHPTGIPGGYAQLAENAVADQAFGAHIALASLEDLITSRRASAQKTGITRYSELADRLEQLGEGRGPAVDQDPELGL